MKTKEQYDFDKEVSRALSCLGSLQHIEGIETDLKLTAARFRQDYIRDSQSDTIKTLFTAARIARENGLEIPRELSYFMIDYLEGKLYGESEKDFIEQAKGHEREDDSIYEYHKHMFTLDEILMGFEKAQEQSSEIIVKGDLDHFLSGEKLEISLSARDYGYLTGTKKEKLTVADTKLFFEFGLGLSESNVTRLFVKYQLNQVFNRWKAKRKLNVKQVI